MTYSGSVSSLTYADCTAFSNGTCSAWTFTPISSTDFIPGQMIAVNQQFSGSFIYNTSVTPVISDDGFQATYLNSLSMATFAAPSFLLPSAVLPTAPSSGYFAVVDGRNGSDIFQLGSSYSAGDYFSNMYMSMVDPTGTVITGFTPPTSLQMSQFAYNTLQLGMLRRPDGDQVQLAGSITLISFATAVPEPGAAILMLLGVALLCVRPLSLGLTLRAKQ